jgi:hypothetical protein
MFHEKYKDRIPNQFGSLLSHHSFEEQFKMIKADTSVIEGIVKDKLKSFRAGQLGGDWRTVLALRRLGYLIDSSVRVEWTPFGRPPYPLNVNLENVVNQSIIEIPLSGFIGPKTRLSSQLKSLYRTLHKIRIPLEFFLVTNSHPADFAYTGKKGLQTLTEFIEFFQQINADFCTLETMSKHVKQKNLDMILRKSLGSACKFLRGS